jgi:hypothetical protein
LASAANRHSATSASRLGLGGTGGVFQFPRKSPVGNGTSSDFKLALSHGRGGVPWDSL